MRPGSSQMVFDLGQANDVTAFAALHKPMIDYGMVMWLDWCCDDVNVSVPGLVPDSWFNQIYAGLPVADGHRGVSWARAGSQLGGGNVLGNDPLASPGTGPWADHRLTVQFTGDTYPTWSTLQFEAEYTAAETSIGLAYVSHDIGSFHADHLPDDLYARWVQFGAFQPALRLHSDHGDRLPWEYDADAQASAETFLRLREAMLPYNYTLGWQAHTTGASMARPLWFAYPTVSDAYNQPGEYMWGDELLVAPVTVGGTQATTQVLVPARGLGGLRGRGTRAAGIPRTGNLFGHDDAREHARLREGGEHRADAKLHEQCRGCGRYVRTESRRRGRRSVHDVRGRGGRLWIPIRSERDDADDAQGLALYDLRPNGNVPQRTHQPRLPDPLVEHPFPDDGHSQRSYDRSERRRTG